MKKVSSIAMLLLFFAGSVSAGDLSFGCENKDDTQVGQVGGQCVTVTSVSIGSLTIAYEDCETDPNVVQGEVNCSTPQQEPEQILPS